MGDRSCTEGLYDRGGDADRDDDADELVDEDEGVVRTMTGTGMSAREDNGDRNFSTSLRRLALSCAAPVAITGRLPAFRWLTFEPADEDEEGMKRSRELVAPMPK